jgi:prophage regulatory protein
MPIRNDKPRARNLAASARAAKQQLPQFPADTPVVHDTEKPRRVKRLLGKRVVEERVDKSYPWIWKQMREGKFPRCVVVGTNIAWLESEIDAWIDALPRRPDKVAVE